MFRSIISESTLQPSLVVVAKFQLNLASSKTADHDLVVCQRLKKSVGFKLGANDGCKKFSFLSVDPFENGIIPLLPGLTF